MEFKDLPLSIQEIAAHTLRQRLSEVETESATKEVIDNMARNIRDAFTSLYGYSSMEKALLRYISEENGCSVEVTNSHDIEKTAKQFAEKEVEDLNSKSQKQPNNHEINELLLAAGFININEYERREKMLSDQPIKIFF
ncbi:hypothetical protein GS235_004430 [Salmonella enterica]|nr:hypothetical protein [Salmonella enterica]